MAVAFKGGIHPPYFKELTSRKAISKIDNPEELIIPLRQHTGAICLPLVEVGDKVRAGEKIGDSEQFVSAPVHAGLSGRVKAIEPRSSSTGETVESIILEVDKKQGPIYETTVRDPEKVDAEEIVDAVLEAGIVGMGGAAFPTPVKLNPPSDKDIDTVLINGCECEPYLTCDHRLMVERTGDLLQGARLLLKAIRAERCIICVENNKEKAIRILREKISDPRIAVRSLPAKYPQGSEKLLIKAVLGREVPSGGLPFDVGVLVQNVATAAAVFEAVVYEKPLVERILTVTGQNINRPSNLLVTIGTPIRHLIRECGGLKDSSTRVIVGGPMTGSSLSTLDLPVVKGTNGVVALPKEMVDESEPYPCLRCGRCVEACPVSLYPNYISNSIENDDLKEAEEWDLMDCIQCGICSYVCLARRPIVQMIKTAKSELAAKKRKND